GNFYRYFWRTYQNDQNWLVFLVLSIAAILWPIITPIAYVRLVEKRSAAIACLTLREVDRPVSNVDVSVACHSQAQCQIQ
ncbi:MAG: hypothetical protein AAFN08_17215, partial [Cyanobacteria bacterium J06559_3]